MKQLFKSAFILFVFPLLSFATIFNPAAKWKFQADGPIRGGVVVDENAVYFNSEDGNLYAVKRKSGELIWKFQTKGSISSSPLIYENLVICQSRDNFIYAVNRSNGSLVWKFQMKPDMPLNWSQWEYFQSDPIASSNTILVGSGDSYLYALSPQGKLKWEFKTGGRIRTAPSVNSNIVYQPSNNGVVYVIDFTSGKLLWKYETEGTHYDSPSSGWDRNSIYSSPRFADSLLFIGSRDGFTYAVNINTHKLKWKFGYGGSWAMTTPAVGKDLVYFGWSDVLVLSANDLMTGKEKWRFKSGGTIFSDPVIAGDEIVFGSGDHKLYSVDRSTGKLKWQYTTSGRINSAPFYDGTTAYVGNDEGQLYAISESPKPNLAVFCPIPKSQYANEYLIIDPKIVPYFKEKGFEHLDSIRLQQFMEARIVDKNPSVIVFAFDRIPVSLIGRDPSQGAVRKYLQSGGKIIWPGGDAPNYFRFNKDEEPIVKDNEQMIASDEKTGAALLDVDFVHYEEGGTYYSKATQEGRNWGLPASSSYTYAQIGNRGIIPLSMDGLGRANAWVRKFSDKPGSGFVSCRPSSYSEPMQQSHLELLYTLAMYGLN